MTITLNDQHRVIDSKENPDLHQNDGPFWGPFLLFLIRRIQAKGPVAIEFKLLNLAFNYVYNLVSFSKTMKNVHGALQAHSCHHRIVCMHIPHHLRELI